MNKPLTFTVITTTQSLARRWGVQTHWFGWRNLFSFAVMTNVAAPAVRLTCFGMCVYLGRIIPRPKTIECNDIGLPLSDEGEKDRHGVTD